MAQSVDPKMIENVRWAKEKIFDKINAELLKTKASLASVFKDATIVGKPNKIHPKKFTNAITKLSGQILQEDAQALSKAIGDPKVAEIDLPTFYAIYRAYGGTSIQSLQEIQDLISKELAEYLKVNRFEFLSEALDTVDINYKGVQKKTMDLSAFEDFLETNYSAKFSLDERKQFAKSFTLPEMPNKIGISELDDFVVKKRPRNAAEAKKEVGKEELKEEPLAAPLTDEQIVEGMMEQIRVACAQTFTDIYQLYKEMDMGGSRQISKDDFASGLASMRLNFDSSDLDLLWRDLDKNKSSRISYLDLATRLEKFSLASSKAIPKTHELYPIFQQIRAYIKDRRGCGIQKVFTRSSMRIEKGKPYLKTIDFRNGLSSMKLTLDAAKNKQLEQYLTGANGMIDYLLFCDNLGYVHRPDTEPVRPATGQVSAYGGQSMYGGPVDQNQIVKAFFLRFSKVVIDHKINLEAIFIELDVRYTGIIQLVDFRRVIEKIIGSEFSGPQINKMSEKFAVEGGKVNYREFILYVKDFHRKTNLVDKIFMEMYHFMVDNKEEELYNCIKQYDPDEKKAFSSETFSKILEENCEIYPGDDDMKLIVKEFDTRKDNTIDFYEFDSQFKEYIRKKEDEQKIKRTDRHIIEVSLAYIRDYCDQNALTLMKAFSKYNIVDGAMTQFDFQLALKDMGDTNLQEQDIFLMSEEVADKKGRIDMNALCKMYNAMFNRTDEDYEAVEKARQIEKLLKKLTSIIFINKIPVEEIFVSYDKDGSRMLEKDVAQKVLKERLGLKNEKQEVLEKFMEYYDSSGLFNFQTLLMDLRGRLEAQLKCQQYLSKLKGYLIINSIFLMDKFKLADFLGQKYLTKEQIHDIIDSTEFKGDNDTLDQVLTIYSTELNGKYNYVEFEEEIRKAPDTFFEEEVVALIKPDKIAPPDDVLEDVARRVTKEKINIREIIVNNKCQKGLIKCTKFIEILQALKIAKYNVYDLNGLADIFPGPEKDVVDYLKFFKELDPVLKRYEVVQDKTGLQWAEHILEEMAIIFYSKKIDCIKYFEGVGAMEDINFLSKRNFIDGMEQLQLTHCFLKKKKETYDEDDQSEVSEREEGKQIEMNKIDETKLFQRMAKELDTELNGTVNIKELSNLVTIKSHQAKIKFEIPLFEMICLGLSNSSTDIMGIFRGYDKEGTNQISGEQFTSEIRTIFGDKLSEIQNAYLAHKYIGKQTYVNYPAFYRDIMQAKSRLEINETKDKIKESQENVKKNLKIFDKLREASLKLNINLNMCFERCDKQKTGFVPNEVLLDIFPRTILPVDEYKKLCQLMDPLQTSSFEYKKFVDFLWIDEENSKQKKAEGLLLMKKIQTDCAKKNIDLDGEFIKASKDRSGYLTLDEIQAVFTAVGIPLKYGQIRALLYFQAIPTDVLGRKNFAELIFKINGHTNVMERLNEAPVQAGEQREAARNVEAIQKQESLRSLNPSAADIGPQFNYFEEYRLYQPTKYKHYISSSQDDLMTKISKYITTSRINLLGFFREVDKFESRYISKKSFFDVLRKVNIELNEEDQKDIFQMPKVLQGNDEVHYGFFLSYLQQKEIETRTNIFPGTKPILLQENVGEEGKQEAILRQQFQDKRLAQEIIKDEELIPRDIVLSQFELAQLIGIFDALKIHLSNRGLDLRETFSKHDPEKSGFIRIVDFYHELVKCEFPCIGKLQVDMMYSYLKEEQPDTISLKRLYAATIEGTELKQFRSESQQNYSNKLREEIITSKICITKLKDYLIEKKIPAAIFKAYAKSGRNTILKAELLEALAAMDYPGVAPEPDLIFSGIRNKTDEYGSLPLLLDLLTKTENITERAKRFDPKVQHTLDRVNEALKTKNVTWGALHNALDVNKDGFINYEEFAEELVKLSGAISKAELVDLAKAIDKNE